LVCVVDARSQKRPRRGVVLTDGELHGSVRKCSTVHQRDSQPRCVLPRCHAPATDTGRENVQVAKCVQSARVPSQEPISSRRTSSSVAGGVQGASVESAVWPRDRRFKPDGEPGCQTAGSIWRFTKDGILLPRCRSRPSLADGALQRSPVNGYRNGQRNALRNGLGDMAAEGVEPCKNSLPGGL
jgi:hypothetical protein